MQGSEACGHRRVTVRTALLVLPPWLAVIVTLVLLETRWVVMVNVAEVEPAATVTLDGTFAAELLLLLTLTVVADVAATLNITVPCEVEPPVTVAGFSVSELSVTPPEGALTVSVVFSVFP